MKKHFERCYDVIGSRDVIGDVTIRKPPSLSYRLPIVTFLLAPLVFEIFDLKVADKQTNTPTEFHAD